MIVVDYNSRSLAIVTFYKDIIQNREFVTDETEEMQFAKFNLQKGHIVNKHYHQKQKSNIHSTAETIIVLDGKIEVSLFEETSNSLIEKVVLESKDSIVMLQGGHSLVVLEDANLLKLNKDLIRKI